MNKPGHRLTVTLSWQVLASTTSAWECASGPTVLTSLCSALDLPTCLSIYWHCLDLTWPQPADKPMLCPSIAYSKWLLDLPTCLWILLMLKYLQNLQMTKVMPKNIILLVFFTVKVTVALGNGRPGHASACSCPNTDVGQMCAELAWMSNQIHKVRIHNLPGSPESWNLYTLLKPSPSKWQCIVGELYYS